MTRNERSGLQGEGKEIGREGLFNKINQILYKNHVCEIKERNE